jgi:NAD(P)H-dependent FMN reductase
MTKIGVVIGSTRDGRQTDKLAKWVALNLQDHTDVELIDLRNYPLSFFDEAISPRFNPDRKPSGVLKKWLDKIAEFDGLVLVTPEYNRSASGVLKNALDVIGHEINDRPIALVAHGSTGGAQAVANLRMAVPGVGAITIPNALFFSDRLAESIDDDGNLDEAIENRPHGPQATLVNQIAQLLKYTEALKALRS